MKIMQNPWIKLKEHLDREDYAQIHALKEMCSGAEGLTLKLELDYKLAAASETNERPGMKTINEFIYYDGQQLIGYIGICSFGGTGHPLEVTGMVKPEYRCQGIFSILNDLVLAECRRRNSGSILILCDKKSDSGQRFVKKTNAIFRHSEFEMYLKQDYPEPEEKQLLGITLRKAVNSDAYEIARQNAIYFGDEDPGSEDSTSNAPCQNGGQEDNMLLPEEEEKRGMTIYLALKDQQIIGKVHLETNSAVGGIYGLGVLPEHRGQGFGRAILLRAIEKFKENNIKTIMLQVAAENSTALHLYQSCGFVETSTMDYYELRP